MSTVLAPVRTAVGREPALIIAALGALLTFFVSFGWDSLNANDAAIILASASAVSAIIVGWATVNTRLTLVTGLARSLLILAVNYSLPLSQEQVGLAVLAISGVAAVFIRKNNSPADTAISHP